MQINNYDMPVHPEVVYENAGWESTCLFLGSNRANRATLEHHVVEAERIASQHQGMLPRSGWLQKHGFGNLDNVIREHPTRFAHIMRPEPTRKTTAQHLITAAKLALDNNGVLPNTRWLRDHGYQSLENAMRKYPRAFSEIYSEWKKNEVGSRMSFDDRVSEALTLIHQHGSMPNGRWLRLNGYHGLYSFIQKHKTSFWQRVTERQTPGLRD